MILQILAYPEQFVGWLNAGGGKVVRISDTGELQKNRRAILPADRITSFVAVYVVVWFFALTTLPSPACDRARPDARARE